MLTWAQPLHCAVAVSVSYPGGGSGGALADTCRWEDEGAHGSGEPLVSPLTAVITNAPSRSQSDR